MERCVRNTLASRMKALVALGLVTSAVSCAGPLKLKMPGAATRRRNACASTPSAAPTSGGRPRSAASTSHVGPRWPGGFAANADVRCDYVDKKMSGKSPKFTCALGPNDEVKVKYGRTNGEVYAEVAATRLLWALGFGADAMYPVRVTCRGCPRDLQEDGTATARGVVFDPAAIERKMKGTELEWDDTVGWSWSELSIVDQAAAPTQRAQRDALALLAAVLQHTDSKSQQQRLVCLDASAKKNPTSCDRPFLMINDLGLTFGHANIFNRNTPGSANFEEWVDEPVWRKPETCEANLSGSMTGTLKNPVISEAGRKFLADLLVQLTDRQLKDLFEVARMPARARVAGTARGRLGRRVGGRVQGQARRDRGASLPELSRRLSATLASACAKP